MPICRCVVFIAGICISGLVEELLIMGQTQSLEDYPLMQHAFAGNVEEIKRLIAGGSSPVQMVSLKVYKEWLVIWIIFAAHVCFSCRNIDVQLRKRTFM